MQSGYGYCTVLYLMCDLTQGGYGVIGVLDGYITAEVL